MVYIDTMCSQFKTTLAFVHKLVRDYVLWLYSVVDVVLVTVQVVLGIETSCDDTGAAVVSSDGVILGQALTTQQELHIRWVEMIMEIN